MNTSRLRKKIASSSTKINGNQGIRHVRRVCTPPRGKRKNGALEAARDDLTFIKQFSIIDLVMEVMVEHIDRIKGNHSILQIKPKFGNPTMRENL